MMKNSKFQIFSTFFLLFSTQIRGFPVTDVPDPDFDDFEIPKTLEDLDPEAVVELFIQFEGAYQKEYRSPLEQAKARAMFGENVATIIKLNQKYAEKDLQFGINYYTDFTDEEFAAKVANLHVDSANSTSEFTNSDEEDIKMPKSFDWRDRKDTVGGVSNQGYCGCSWGYTIASLVQSTYSIKYNKFVSPSEQQLCDCAQGGNTGCGGGSVQKGMKYVKRNGVVLEKNYQKNVEPVMEYCEDRGSIKVSNYNFVTPQSSSAIQKVLIQSGPIGIGFKISKSFRHYKSGIFSLEDCQGDDFIGWHSAVIVGFGVSENSENSEDVDDFWIVKNSWSPSFGENGFFKFARGSDLCEIESKMPIFVEI